MVAPIITYTFKQLGYQLSEDLVVEGVGYEGGGRMPGDLGASPISRWVYEVSSFVAKGSFFR